MKNKKVLFVYTHFSSFVKNDFEFLSEKFDVTPYHFKPSRGIPAFLKEIAIQAAFLLFGIWKFDSVFIWFADQHSILPVLAAKLSFRKSYLVVGGYDVCRIPSINYGVFCSFLRGLAAKWSMRYSSFNLPVSDHVERKIRYIARKENNIRVYNCFKPEPVSNSIQTSRKMVLTIANIDAERTFFLKGIDLFIETARLSPGITFCIAGFNREKLGYLINDFPENVKVLDRLEPSELVELYNASLIYCQFSLSESFGVALAESIYYGCIPLITNQGGMPEVVGDRNQILNRNPKEIANRIKYIFSGKETFNEKYRDRLKELFNVDIRAKNIIALLGH